MLIKDRYKMQMVNLINWKPSIFDGEFIKITMALADKVPYFVRRSYDSDLDYSEDEMTDVKSSSKAQKLL